MDHALRRSRLLARLPELQVDAFLVAHLPNVRYLTGYSGSNGQLLASGADGVFLTDGRYVEQSRREVPDLERVIYSDDWIGKLKEACERLGVGRLGFESEYTTFKAYEDLGKAAGERVALQDEVGRLRWSKDAEELVLIAEAQALSDRAFEAVLGKLREGMSERDLSLELQWEMLEGGADGVAFETIAAFGANAAEPHHFTTDRALRRGDVVKMDFGAVHEGYHADMTRTVAFGEPPKELRNIYEVVREAQQRGSDAVRAGITGGEADRAARAVIEEAGYGEAFSHSLGHGVGLEVHEGPTLRSGGEDVLPEGAVVTIEPGIYLPGLGGVRIEDMVEVTADGCRSMPSATKELLVL